MFAASVIAQTMETNISGLVIKEYNCFEQKWVYGKLINRNNEKFSGKIRIKIIDSENDIMWQGAKQVTVDGMNGTGFAIEIGLGKCIAPNKVQITLER
jgi:hypothetical protein